MTSPNEMARVPVPVNEFVMMNEESNQVVFAETAYDVLHQQFVLFTRQMVGDKLMKTEVRMNQFDPPNGLPKLTSDEPTQEISIPLPNKNGEMVLRKGTITLLAGHPEVYVMRFGRTHIVTRRHSNSWQIAVGVAAGAAVVFGIGVGVGVATASDSVDVDIEYDSNGNVTSVDVTFGDDDEEDDEEDGGSGA